MGFPLAIAAERGNMPIPYDEIRRAMRGETRYEIWIKDSKGLRARSLNHVDVIMAEQYMEELLSEPLKWTVKDLEYACLVEVKRKLLRVKEKR